MNRVNLKNDGRLHNTSRIPAYEYARKYGFLTSAVIYKIKAGILTGVLEDGQWYVIPFNQSGYTSPTASVPETPSPTHKALPIKDTLRKWFAPSYDEVTLFVMGVSALLLFTIDPVMRGQVTAALELLQDPRLIWISLSFLIGLLLAIFHAFTDRDKSNFERRIILLFAINLHVITAFEAMIRHVGTEPENHLFPLLNFFYALFLLALWRENVIDESCIDDDQASRLQIGIALVITYATLLVGYHLLKYHWTVTLSMTIALASTIGRGIDYMVFLFQETKT